MLFIFFPPGHLVTPNFVKTDQNVIVFTFRSKTESHFIMNPVTTHG